MRPPSLPLLRRLVALAAVLVVAGGAVGVHDGAVEVHGGAAAHVAAAQQETAFACDADHGRTTHVESARKVERHDCAACLHRLHSRGGALGAVACATLATAADSLPAIASAAAPFPPLAHAPSRGPPLG